MYFYARLRVMRLFVRRLDVRRLPPHPGTFLTTLLASFGPYLESQQFRFSDLQAINGTLQFGAVISIMILYY